MTTESSPAFQALWPLFREAGGENYYQHWLYLQCSLLHGSVQGVLVMGDPETGAYAPVSSWSEKSVDPQILADICESALEERSALFTRLAVEGSTAGDETCHSYAVACPLIFSGKLYGVVAVELLVDSEAALRPVMEQLQWGLSWLELHLLKRESEESEHAFAEMKSSFNLLAAVLAEQHSSDAAMVFVTELAAMTGCDRVSLGLYRDNCVKLEAISNSANFSGNMQLIRLICNAMEESILQKSEIVYPQPEGAKVLVTREHADLSGRYGSEAILTVPLYGKDSYWGVITLERPADLPFQQQEVRVCSGVFALVGPILEAKQKHDMPLPLKAWDAFKVQSVRLLGKGYAGRKLLAAALVCLAVFLSTATGEYRITATTVLEPMVKRSIASPFNGYVKQAAVRPGDVVRQGALLCTLDDRDLHLEHSKWQNQQSQYQRQRQEAIATNDRAKANIISSQMDQARAQLNLVGSQLKRTSLTAPFEGIVVSGDLSQRIGGAVEQGEVLFEVAPLNSYRVVLQVDEYQIDQVRPGQTGRLVLPTMAERNFDFTVEKVTPISMQKEGNNYFRVEARLELSGNSLRPGMEGVAKISVDRRKLISIWTRELRNWLRIKVWYWLP